MSLEHLDFIFPFFVLAYGATLTFVLHSPQLEKLAQSHLPESLAQQLRAHKVLALICLVLGALWSLQNLWTQNLPLF